MTRSRALSLVEVILAIVIMGLAVPALMIQLASGIRSQTEAAIQLNLVQLASERMGEVFADCADSTRGYEHVQEANYPLEIDPAGWKGYQRRTAVREVSPVDYVSLQPGSGIKRFAIEVTGPNGHTLRVESFVSQPLAAEPQPQRGTDAQSPSANAGPADRPARDRQRQTLRVQA